MTDRRPFRIHLGCTWAYQLTSIERRNVRRVYRRMRAAGVARGVAKDGIEEMTYAFASDRMY
jgi:hypothetical protein